jgi:predicted flap endonuclease-1-like 5' DNA nuclease
MSYPIEAIEGIGAALAGKLETVGIKRTTDLLESCGHAKGRSDVASKTGLSEKQLLKWANMADLMRISGVAGEFAELLEAVGVDTVKELQHRNAENLASKMVEVNEAKKLTRRTPAASEVEKWIEQAKTLQPMISY